MKQSLLVGIAILILSLSGCSKSAPEGDFSVNQTINEKVVALVPTKTETVSPTPEPTVTLTATSTPFIPVGEGEDYFVYSLHYVDSAMMLYLVDQNLQFEILPEVVVSDFALSSRNQLAYRVILDSEEKLFISDYPFSGNDAKVISSGNFEYKLFSWSQNGQFLAFTQKTAEETKLMIWNGYTTFPIYEIKHWVWELEWSADNRLAFTEYGQESRGDDPAEVFVWDGLEIMNVSQNTLGRDDNPVWSRDGRLAFRSERNNEFDIFIWDGYSSVDGMPDFENYQNIFPEITIYHSLPSWTNEDDLSFIGIDKVYIVSDENVKIISQDRLIDFTGPVWSNDGYIALYSFYGGPTFIYVLDETNEMVLKSKGQYSPAWGDNGNLLFCQFEDNKWTMNMWNRENIIGIASGWQVIGKWPNGEVAFCSSG